MNACLIFTKLSGGENIILRTKSGAEYSGKFIGYEKLDAVYKPERFIKIKNARGKEIYITDKAVIEIYIVPN